MTPCARCRSQPAELSVAAGVPICMVCARVMGISPSPQVRGKARVAGWFPDPYAMGQSAGSDAKKSAGEAGGISTAIGKSADAASSISKTVQTIAIVGGLFGAAFVTYALYRAHQQAEGLKRLAVEHPETIAKLAAI